MMNISFLDRFLSGSKVFNAFAMDLVETRKQHFFHDLHFFYKNKIYNISHLFLIFKFKAQNYNSHKCLFWAIFQPILNKNMGSTKFTGILVRAILL